MNITLIGMSNIGKSHWALRLEREAGFRRIDCDALVESALEPHLKAQGFAGVQEVAKWMGQPYAPQYQETSREFVRCEREVMLKVVSELRQSESAIVAPCVIDTCGSVIYSGDEIKEGLKAATQVVYLEASEEHQAELFARYIAEPKPVIWGNAFSRENGEDVQHALERCYPRLLSSRDKLYREWADCSVPFKLHRARHALLDQIGAMPHHTA